MTCDYTFQVDATALFIYILYYNIAREGNTRPCFINERENVSLSRLLLCEIEITLIVIKSINV